MEANYLDQNHRFIDSALVLRDNIKSRTGAYMSFGKGVMNGISTSQQINTTSSTKVEVMTVHNNMPVIL